MLPDRYESNFAIFLGKKKKFFGLFCKLSIIPRKCIGHCCWAGRSTSTRTRSEWRLVSRDSAWTQDQALWLQAKRNHPGSRWSRFPALLHRRRSSGSVSRKVFASLVSLPWTFFLQFFELSITGNNAKMLQKWQMLFYKYYSPTINQSPNLSLRQASHTHATTQKTWPQSLFYKKYQLHRNKNQPLQLSTTTIGPGGRLRAPIENRARAAAKILWKLFATTNKLAKNRTRRTILSKCLTYFFESVTLGRCHPSCNPYEGEGFGVRGQSS